MHVEAYKMRPRAERGQNPGHPSSNSKSSQARVSSMVIASRMERAQNVGDEIVDVLDSNGQPQQ